MSFVGQKISESFQKLQAKLGFKAQRQVPPDVSRRQLEEEVPFSWKGDEALYGYVNRYMLRGSGAGFVVPPYAAMWGLQPALTETRRRLLLLICRSLLVKWAKP